MNTKQTINAETVSSTDWLGELEAALNHIWKVQDGAHAADDFEIYSSVFSARQALHGTIEILRRRSPSH